MSREEAISDAMLNKHEHLTTLLRSQGLDYSKQDIKDILDDKTLPNRKLSEQQFIKDLSNVYDQGTAKALNRSVDSTHLEQIRERLSQSIRNAPGSPITQDKIDQISQKLYSETQQMQSGVKFNPTMTQAFDQQRQQLNDQLIMKQQMQQQQMQQQQMQQRQMQQQKKDDQLQEKKSPKGQTILKAATLAGGAIGTAATVLHTIREHNASKNSSQEQVLGAGPISGEKASYFFDKKAGELAALHEKASQKIDQIMNSITSHPAVKEAMATVTQNESSSTIGQADRSAAANAAITNAFNQSAELKGLAKEYVGQVKTLAKTEKSFLELNANSNNIDKHAGRFAQNGNPIDNMMKKLSGVDVLKPASSHVKLHFDLKSQLSKMAKRSDALSDDSRKAFERSKIPSLR